MYINAIGHYLPSEVVPNSYFKEVNGLSDEWIFQRTGIKERRKASAEENSNSMAISAISNTVASICYPIEEVDLVVGATYTPYDTVGTIAHVVQRHFDITNAAALTITSACSSLINAIEIVEGYFAMGKATKALVVASEHNTYYSNDSDEKCGHLWGDGAAAVFLSKDRLSETDMLVEGVVTHGLGHIGRGPEGVLLLPKECGIVMPYGKDVFVNACTFMIQGLKELLDAKGLSFGDLDYIVPHQANMRIITQIASMLDFPLEKIFANIELFGNTGCGSTAIALSQNKDKFVKNDLLGITVFGGGYSSGAMLVRV
ncbi:3-oxoacyl-ACP synthase III family protein [Acetobacteroides hydrogenigenes]|uniref:3-oxoacyl-[acyl-carrier-protein] synthase-3 n=1 Tax=Acetobacteroides hydrogenigenes TaxID=979970 RepID=A0A4R2ECY2_9BACT|nr:ketoacyl-ACP synthase III [Acetobacteroides hydrogenigenes]TCN64712.1 3-oxoacyl-[acyl-carrier-protein] synthase-3 [Acetobacteroides hydrogenigenes]